MHFVGVEEKIEHGAKYYVTVTAVNSVNTTENAFSEAIGVDLNQPQKGMVVDLTSVYRIDVTSSDNTVAVNAEICPTEEGNETNLFRLIHVDTGLYTVLVRIALI